MPKPDEITPAQRLRLALDMADFGIAMMRENLRRAHPVESSEQIERRLVEWLHHRPGAEHGDAVGPPGHRTFAPLPHRSGG